MPRDYWHLFGSVARSSYCGQLILPPGERWLRKSLARRRGTGQCPGIVDWARLNGRPTLATLQACCCSDRNEPHQAHDWIGHKRPFCGMTGESLVVSGRIGRGAEWVATTIPPGVHSAACLARGSGRNDKNGRGGRGGPGPRSFGAWAGSGAWGISRRRGWTLPALPRPG